MAQDMETDAVNGPRMDLRVVVMKIDNELHDEDVLSLKFLCQGLVISNKLKRAETAHELIALLESASLLSGSDYFILADLLQYIGRVDILEALDFNEQEVLYRRRFRGSDIKPFYVLLFKIAEEMTEEDVKKAAFMYGKVPNSKKLTSGLDLFTIMYQHHAISPENVRPLVQIFESMERNDIVELVGQYAVTEGDSVLRNLERQFVRAMQLRGVNVPQQLFTHPRGDAPGKVFGPHPDDRDIPRTPNSKTSGPFSGFPSMANNPSISGAPTLFHNVVPSVPGTQDGGPHASVNRADVTPEVQPQMIPQTQVNIVKISEDPDLVNSSVVPWNVLSKIAKIIPEEYWLEISYQLGIHHPAAASGTNKTSRYHLNIARLNKWLELPETRQQNDVAVKMILVRALKIAGPKLLAETVAAELNIDINAAFQMSLPTSSQDSVYVFNETASQASAAPESLHYVANMNQPGNAGDAYVAPVANQFRHLSLAVPNPLPHYDMDANPRGICVIINNRDFYKDQRRPEAKLMISREGTDVDRDKLVNTFKDLNFIVDNYVFDNMTDTQMLQVISEIALMDHSAFDCIVCCILTHGVLGSLYGVNGMTVPIKDLTGPLRAQFCPSLAGKPKLFFMQACQGKEKQRGHDIQVDAAMEDELETDSPGQLIPNEADFLLGYATVPGFVSYRSKTRGSWYITKLTEMLRKFGYDHDILDILTLVNYEVGKGDANMEGEIFKQSPAPMYSLRKKLMFTRPVDMHNSVSLRVGLQPLV